MSDLVSQDRLIDDLAATLRPVRRLASPWLKATAWLGVVVATAALLAPFADFDQIRQRLMAVPDMWAAVLGSGLTAVFAAVAAFQTSLPDRSPRWAMLPLPTALLWIGASGMGCLRDWIIPSTHLAPMREARQCLVFILGFSVPLSILMVMMLRRSFPLRPGLTAGLCGLATAAAAASLLTMFHPFDASATDIAVHVVAVLGVVLASRLAGGRVLGRM